MKPQSHIMEKENSTVDNLDTVKILSIEDVVNSRSFDRVVEDNAHLVKNSNFDNHTLFQRVSYQLTDRQNELRSLQEFVSSLRLKSDEEKEHAINQRFGSLNRFNSYLSNLEENVLVYEDANQRLKQLQILKLKKPGLVNTIDQCVKTTALSILDLGTRNFDFNVSEDNGEVNGVKYALRSMPQRKDYSGDLIYTERLDNDKVVFALFDVMGKGKPADQVAKCLEDLLITAKNKDDPAVVLKELDENLVASNLIEGFVGGTYIVYDKKTNTVLFSEAGSEIALSHITGGNIKKLNDVIPGKNVLLGLYPNAIYTNRSVKVTPGNRMFIATDGVKDELFGRMPDDKIPASAYLKVFNSTRSATETADALYRTLRLKNGKYPHDDSSLIILDF